MSKLKSRIEELVLDMKASQLSLAVLLDIQTETLSEVIDHKIEELKIKIAAYQLALTILSGVQTEVVSDVIKFKSVRHVGKTQSPLNLQILEFLKSKALRGARAVEVARNLKVTPPTVSWRLSELKKQKMLRYQRPYWYSIEITTPLTKGIALSEHEDLTTHVEGQLKQ